MNIKGDCRMNSLSKILKSIGVQLTPSMCFGIGEGLGFSYWVERAGRLPYLAILGRNLEIEKNLCKNMNIQLIERFDVEGKVSIDEVLKKNFSVVISVDKFFLSYLSKDGKQNGHMGLHTILCDCIIEKNAEKLYSITDGLLDNLNPVYINELELGLARFSEWKPFPPGGKYYFLKKTSESGKENLLNVINKSIHNNVKRILDNDELTSLNMFIKEIEGFLKKVNTEDVRVKNIMAMQLRVLYSLIYEMEGTHSFYRGQYSNFLKEVSIKFNINEFLHFANTFDLIADKWREISMLLSVANDIDIERLLQLMTQAKEEEEIVLSKLFKFVSKSL